MTQIIVFNDTGSSISAATEIDLDGVNTVPPVKKIRSGALVNMYNGSTTTAPSASITTVSETSSAPTTGNYAYLVSDSSIKLGCAMAIYQVLILDVVLEGELVRT